MLTDGRLGSGPMPSLTQNVHRIELESELDGLQEYLEIDLAHIIALERCGALSRSSAAGLIAALLDIAGPNPRQELVIEESQGSILLQIESYLIARCGSDGGMVQLARSRIDQNAAAMRMIARRCAMEVFEVLLSLGKAQLAAAQEHDDLPAPGYTHLQHSQPGTLGHYFNAHYWVTSRSIERLSEILARIDRSALGGAALVGTDWPLDRHRTAELLGHQDVVMNARDAGVFALDVGAELAMTLAMSLSGMARLAGDIYFWSSSEVRLARLHPGLCGTSSMMPQKRNPYAVERVRALAGESVGWPASQLGLLKMATSTDCDLVFTRNRVPEMCASTAGAARLMTDVITTLEVDTEAMRRSAGAQWATASALADELVRRKGCSFREAHDIVARLVRLSEERGTPSDQVRTEDLRLAVADAGLDVEVDDVDVSAVLDVDRFLASRRSLGGCAPEERARLAGLATDDLRGLSEQFDVRKRRIETAREQLFATARELATP